MFDSGNSHYELIEIGHKNDQTGLKKHPRFSY